MENLLLKKTKNKHIYLICLKTKHNKYIKNLNKLGFYNKLNSSFLLKNTNIKLSIKKGAKFSKGFLKYIYFLHKN